MRNGPGPAEIALGDIALADARTGRAVDLGDGLGLGVLTVIRHRY